MKYDYLIVGAGLFGATFAYKAKQAGKKCLVIDKRPHLGGNIYCENVGKPLEHKGFAKHLAEHDKLASYDMLVLVLQNVVGSLVEGTGKHLPKAVLSPLVF